jgi:UDP-N-acetylglucosamine 4,6-dehydratase
VRILVTGGTGAFGRSFVRTALTWPDVEWVAVYSRDEHKQQKQREGLDDPGDRVRFFLGDVRDLRRLEIATRSATHVVHAAALKVVPWLEYNPTEGIETNVRGAMNVAEAAIRNGVERVVGLSTDKACAPVNLYGATKLAAEKLFLAANAYGGLATSFSMVRYGNVAGSTCSVIPIWRKMIADGSKMLPITDPSMSRFWMTLDEAVELVRRALFEGRGGETWIPKLRAYGIMELAQAVARDAGLIGMRTRVLGTRPGEKLAESMISADESPWAFDCGDHYELCQPGGEGPGGRMPATLSTGKPVDIGFTLTSEEVEWMTVEELTEKLKTIP